MPALWWRRIRRWSTKCNFPFWSQSNRENRACTAFFRISYFLSSEKTVSMSLNYFAWKNEKNLEFLGVGSVTSVQALKGRCVWGKDRKPMAFWNVVSRDYDVAKGKKQKEWRNRALRQFLPNVWKIFGWEITRAAKSRSSDPTKFRGNFAFLRSSRQNLRKAYNV